jgi:5-methylcytosine-specific restriction endonuclease McrBC regulatory subunit McrC
MASFPPLRLAVLTGLSDVKKNLDSLNQADCPYDEETKTLLLDLLAPKVVEKVIEKEVHVTGNTRGRPSKDIQLSEEDQQLILDELRSTLAELNKLGSGDDTAAMDVRERIQVAKTKGDQIERLLKMVERHTTAQRMQHFKDEVIRILDDLVSEEGREQFMKRIEPFR